MKKLFVTLIAVVGFLGLGAVVISATTTMQSNDSQKESSNASNSDVDFHNENHNGTCYCNYCENQPLSQKLEKEYDCVPCDRCGRTGKLSCRDENGKLGHWEDCPDCTCARDGENVANIRHHCGVSYGYIWKVVRQYYIYYCPRCKREYSGC